MAYDTEMRWVEIMTINRMVLAIILDDQEEILYLKAHWPSRTGNLASRRK